MSFTSETARAAGRKGGKATLERHGREHYQRIGRQGFQVTCDRYFFGNRHAMLEWFSHAGLAAMDATMPESMRKWFPRPWPGRRYESEEQ